MKKVRAINSTPTFLSSKACCFLAAFLPEGNKANIPNPQTLSGALTEIDLSFPLFSTKDLLNPKASDKRTFAFRLQTQSPQVEKPKVEEVKESHDIGPQEKKLEIDTQWVKSKVKVSVAVHWYFYFVQVFLAQVRHTPTQPAGSRRNQYTMRTQTRKIHPI